MAFLEIKNLQYTVESQEQPVLEDLNFSVDSGEYICIAGTNGSGKSTLLRIINALQEPRSGEVLLEGVSVHSSEGTGQVRQNIGMVFQNPENQIISTLVEEDLAFGPENLGWPREEILRSIDAILERVEMSEYRHRPTHQLSAGQRQRIALAGVLIMNPRCLILDEATTMLNPTAREDFLSFIKELHRQGMTILSVTHEMQELLQADRVLVMQEGRIILDNRPEDLLRSEDLPRMGLEALPWTDLARKRQWTNPALPLSLEEFYLAGNWTNPPEKKEKAASEKPVILSLDHLSFQYNEETEALKDISLELRQGERLILAGETGSGKSTLLQLIAGLRLPGQGSLEWNSAKPVCGLAFQNPEAQLFKVFLGDDVAFGPMNQGIRGKKLVERVRRAMNMAGLPYLVYRDRKVRELSGGEQRKAALAGILALEPSVLLLDEPTAGLDPQARKELNQLLDRLQAQGCTLIIATHHMEEASRGDRILHLHSGRIAYSGKPDAFFFQDRQGLLPPPAVELMQMIRRDYPAWPAFYNWQSLEQAVLAQGGTD